MARISNIGFRKSHSKKTKKRLAIKADMLKKLAAKRRSPKKHR